MLAVQVGGLLDRDEELGVVCVPAAVRHAEQARLRVLDLEALVRKLLAVDGLAASAVAAGEVATLAHEGRDDPVEGAALVVQGLAQLAVALLARAQGPEVLDSLGRLVSVEAHDNPPGLLPADLHVEKDLVGDGGVAGHVLALEEVLPPLPLALLENGHDEAALAVLLADLPTGLLRVALLPQGVVDDWFLALQANPQALLRNLDLAVLRLDAILDGNHDLDILCLVRAQRP
mmetsp:Transcript_40671/g.126775  ORF Transcript_40671/g.126775 Transcript_40671/m.126775 type:complete len:232 (-) Transcript_40671:73-768(-)